MMRMLGIAGAAAALALIADGSANAQQAAGQSGAAPSAHSGGLSVALGDGSVRSPRSGAATSRLQRQQAPSGAAGAINRPSSRLYQSCANGTHYNAPCNSSGRQALEHYDFPGEYAQRFDGVSPQGSNASRRVDSAKMRAPATTGTGARSNVFAPWMTTGFFNPRRDTSPPPPPPPPDDDCMSCD